MGKTLIIGGRTISNYGRPFIVAEGGINHNGSLSVAKKMIAVAAEAGADAVKFQFFQKGKLINPWLKESNDVIRILSRYHLSKQQVKEMKIFADRAGIVFFVTPFDCDGVEFLKTLDMAVYKIASGDINNYMLLESIASAGKPVIFSTGASTLKETDTAAAFLKKRVSNLVILHCVSLYPARLEQMNLRTIELFRDRYRIASGLSDHTMGLEASLAAVTLGAAMIEKHFTLNRKMKGPDHALSMMPEELKRLRGSVDALNASLGTYGKQPLDAELKGNYWGRRSFVAVKDIVRGVRINNSMIMPLRPDKALSASAYYSVKMKKARRDIKAGDFIRKEDLG